MIKENIQKITLAIADLSKAEHCQNPVQLLAVSKNHTINEMIEAYEAGQRLFGESYVQEAIPKIQYFKEHGYQDIQWHFIGPIQSNKAKLIAENFDVVHSVDRIKIAQKLQEHRPSNLPPLAVLIEINISNEPQKSGASWEEYPEILATINHADRLVLKGLMGVATDTDDNAIITQQFQALQQLFLTLKSEQPTVDMLSIGMSADYPTAIRCGSTIVRIGTGIFGARIKKPVSTN